MSRSNVSLAYIVHTSILKLFNKLSHPQSHWSFKPFFTSGSDKMEQISLTSCFTFLGIISLIILRFIYTYTNGKPPGRSCFVQFQFTSDDYILDQFSSNANSIGFDDSRHNPDLGLLYNLDHGIAMGWSVVWKVKSDCSNHSGIHCCDFAQFFDFIVYHWYSGQINPCIQE